MELPRLRSGFQKRSGSWVIAHSNAQTPATQRSSAMWPPLCCTSRAAGGCTGTWDCHFQLWQDPEEGEGRHRIEEQVPALSYHGGVRGKGWALFSQQDAWQLLSHFRVSFHEMTDSKINQLHHHTLARNAALSLSSHRLPATTPGAGNSYSRAVSLPVHRVRKDVFYL